MKYAKPTSIALALIALFATLSPSAVGQKDNNGQWLRKSEKSLAEARVLAEKMKAKADKLRGAEFNRAEQELEKAIDGIDGQIDELDAAMDERDDAADDLLKAQEILLKAQEQLLAAQNALYEGQTGQTSRRNDGSLRGNVQIGGRNVLRGDGSLQGNVQIGNGNVQIGRSGVVVGSGTRATQDRSLRQFDKVELHIPAALNIKRGEKVKCIVSGDNNIIPLITTQVMDRCLRIHATGSYSPRQEIRITIDVPVLKGVVSEAPGKIAIASRVVRADTGRVEVVSKGTASITIADATGENLLVRSKGTGGITIADATINKLAEVVAEGTASITMTQLTAERLVVKSSATGVITAQGKVKELIAVLDGTGRLKLAGLEAAKAEIKHSGTGRVEVCVTETLTAEANGPGDITYSGNPTEVNASGDGPGRVVKQQK